MLKSVRQSPRFRLIHPIRSIGTALITALVAAGLAVPALAQQEADERPCRKPSPEILAQDKALVTAMNRGQASAAAAQNRRNMANQAAYERALAAQDAEAERRRSDYDRRMAQWRADVAACRAGDYGRC